MGTHIDAYIELDYGKQVPAFSDRSQIFSLADGTFNLDRAYDMFDALAGGRETLMRDEDRDSSRSPLIAPRGIPQLCSETVTEKFTTDGTHCATWLLTEEFDASLAHHRISLDDQPVGYRILRSAMGILVRELGPTRVRLVLWFS